MEEVLLNKVEFRHSMPPRSRYGDGALLIFDRKLKRVSPIFKDWICAFPLSYGVAAGEELKSIENFPLHIQKILKLVENIPRKKLRVISLGGGSVGDFSGFVASVLKRGVALEHIPSTWLAAIDSAHGGKTALNVKGIKNQIGTFHQAERITIVKKILIGQPKKLEIESMGELLKMALISSDLRSDLKRFSRGKKNILWQVLPQAIESKYQIVMQDFKEISGARQVLNLGHTVGHVFESYYSWSHGKSVGYGLVFAIKWSLFKKEISRSQVSEVLGLLDSFLDIPNLSFMESAKWQKIPKKSFRRLLLNDKKISHNGKVNFIFLTNKNIDEDFGVKISSVSLESICDEAYRQGWIKN